jgi:Zinc dependent phospholipase C
MPRLFRAFALATLGLQLAYAPAFAWDSVTHREITYLAIRALPPSPLKDLFLQNAARLQYFAIQPDVLRAKYGDESEKIRHYIDLEYYGAAPFDVLVPDRAAMIARFGKPMLLRSGTLPWTIVDFSNELEQEWPRGDCHDLLRLAGFLAHYVGDASQPLHTTRHYDGYEGDRGVHARVERAVDFDIRQVSLAAEPRIHLMKIDSVWQTAIAEIRDSNSHVDQLLQADRAARQDGSGHAYDEALISRAGPMIEGQIALAASVLGSIWLYEWRHGGSPAGCESTTPR